MSWSIVLRTSTSTPCRRMIEALTSMSPSVFEISGERLRVPLRKTACRPVKSHIFSVSAMACTLPTSARLRNPGRRPAPGLLAQELLEALWQLEVGRVGLLGRVWGRLGAGVRSTRHTEGTVGLGNPCPSALVRGGLLLLCAFGRVAALAFLALGAFAALLCAAHTGNCGHARDPGATTAAHRTHHLLGLTETLEQAVHLGHRHT